MQLTVLSWDRKDADALITEAGALLDELDDASTPFVQHVRLHFTILQVGAANKGWYERAPCG